MFLEGRIGWITGASRGIGRATAIEAARQGANLILTARSLEGLEETSRHVAEISSVRATLIPCDVSKYDSLKTTFKEIHQQTKTLDFVVNNAGILRDAVLGMITDSHIEEVMRTNAFSVIHIMQFA